MAVNMTRAFKDAWHLWYQQADDETKKKMRHTLAEALLIQLEEPGGRSRKKKGIPMENATT